MTGHDNGLVTIALAEADDTCREQSRSPCTTYRTLLRHFRHETGHYFWDRLVRDRGRLGLAGRCSATTARIRPGSSSLLWRRCTADWQSRSSAYATSHPWEARRDLGPLCAHRRHAGDHPGLRRVDASCRDAGRRLDASVESDPYRAAGISQLIDAWLPLSLALNSLKSRDGPVRSYPFVLSPRRSISWARSRSSSKPSETSADPSARRSPAPVRSDRRARGTTRHAGRRYPLICRLTAQLAVAVAQAARVTTIFGTL